MALAVKSCGPFERTTVGHFPCFASGQSALQTPFVWTNTIGCNNLSHANSQENMITVCLVNQESRSFYWPSAKMRGHAGPLALVWTVGSLPGFLKPGSGGGYPATRSQKITQESVMHHFWMEIKTEIVMDSWMLSWFINSMISWSYNGHIMVI